MRSLGSHFCKLSHNRSGHGSPSAWLPNAKTVGLATVLGAGGVESAHLVTADHAPPSTGSEPRMAMLDRPVGATAFVDATEVPSSTTAPLIKANSWVPSPRPSQEALERARNYEESLRRDFDRRCAQTQTTCPDPATLSAEDLVAAYSEIVDGALPVHPRDIREAFEHHDTLTLLIERAYAYATQRTQDAVAQRRVMQGYLEKNLAPSTPFLARLSRALSSAPLISAFERVGVKVQVFEGEEPRVYVASGLLDADRLIPYATMEQYLGKEALSDWRAPLVYSFPSGTLAASYNPATQQIWISEGNETTGSQEFFHSVLDQRYPWLLETLEGTRTSELLSEGFTYLETLAKNDQGALRNAALRSLNLMVSDRVDGRRFTSYAFIDDAVIAALLNQSIQFDLEATDWSWIDVTRFAEWHAALGKTLVGRLAEGPPMLEDVREVIVDHIDYRVPAGEPPIGFVVEPRALETWAQEGFDVVRHPVVTDTIARDGIDLVRFSPPDQATHLLQWPTNRMLPIAVALTSRRHPNPTGSAEIDHDGDGLVDLIEVRVPFEDVAFDKSQTQRSTEAMQIRAATAMAGGLYGHAERRLNSLTKFEANDPRLERAGVLAELEFITRLVRILEDQGSFPLRGNKELYKAALSDMWDDAGKRLRALKEPKSVQP